ncbi:uncharacterized protein Dana_GF26885 [Drosophila ananassae]|uniref:Uncharacterized protein n=1 Tax=Drosophila ananassae TaxID=7217 RepID=A0A0N8P1N1_DROAN|nr:uncharacterized protein Dana_GF26885 [Drosophila ananassae]
MPRQVLKYGELDHSKRISPCRTKLEVKCIGGVAGNQQPHTQPQPQPPREQPVGVKNPLHFLNKKSTEEITVHWTRAGHRKFPPIKLLPPW